MLVREVEQRSVAFHGHLQPLMDRHYRRAKIDRAAQQALLREFDALVDEGSAFTVRGKLPRELNRADARIVLSLQPDIRKLAERFGPGGLTLVSRTSLLGRRSCYFAAGIVHARIGFHALERYFERSIGAGEHELALDMIERIALFVQIWQALRLFWQEERQLASVPIIIPAGHGVWLGDFCRRDEVATSPSLLHVRTFYGPHAADAAARRIADRLWAAVEPHRETLMAEVICSIARFPRGQEIEHEMPVTQQVLGSVLGWLRPEMIPQAMRARRASPAPAAEPEPAPKPGLAMDEPDPEPEPESVPVPRVGTLAGTFEPILRPPRAKRHWRRAA
jgi:hypothetical protein